MQTIHINLVSDQLLPNLIPTIADTNCAGVIFIFGDDKRLHKGKLLERIYQERGIKVLHQSIGKNSFDIIELKKQAAELIDYLKNNHMDKRWVLNATGGTKPMAFAMLMAFEKYNASLPSDGDIALSIYTDSDNKTIPVLNDNIQFNLPYQSILNLNELLLANDFELQDATDNSNDHDIKDRAELTIWLAKAFSGACKDMLGTLQYLASEAKKELENGYRKTLTMKVPNGRYAEVYQKLAQEKLIIWQEGSGEIEFCSVDACRYLAGLWLEEYVYLQALECGFEEVAMNVEGHWGSGNHFTKGKNNEFDVLIRHKNQLLTIECKARNWDSAEAASSKQDTLHKLDNLGKKLGGLYGRNLLVSVYELTDAMHERAKTNRIMVCDNIAAGKVKAQLEQIKKQMD